MKFLKKLIKIKTDARKIGKRRIIKYTSNANTLERLAGGDLDATLTDLKRTQKLVDVVDDQIYQAWTKSDLKTLLKMLWKVANGYDQEDQPKEIRNIKGRPNARERKLPQNLITEPEMREMMKVAGNARDKAIIHLLYEAGPRPHELLGLKKSDIEFAKEGGRVHIPEGSKTGTRSILIIDSVPDLARWLSGHPLKGVDSPLFPAERTTTPLHSESLLKVIKTTAKDAGIKRRITPYLFRHTAATRLANILTDAQMKAYFGWAQNSDMASTYIHLSGRDVDAPILAAHGKKVDKAELEGKLLPLNCERCGKQSAHDATACQYCMLPFDKDKAKRADAAMQEQMKTMKTRMDAMEQMFNKKFRKSVGK